MGYEDNNMVELESKNSIDVKYGTISTLFSSMVMLWI